jgi:hypothetical protein
LRQRNLIRVKSFPPMIAAPHHVAGVSSAGIGSQFNRLAPPGRFVRTSPRACLLDPPIGSRRKGGVEVHVIQGLAE